MKKLLFSLPILLLFAFFFRANASHVIGSEITWTCVGQDSFLIKLDVYRDCNGITLGASPITFKCSTSGTTITSLSIPVGTPVDVTPNVYSSCNRCSSAACTFPYGIHKYTMLGIVNLNSSGNCCNIRLSWEQCCRNAAITTGAAGANFYTEALLNRCQNPCDNSPQITNNQVGILCTGMDYNFQSGTIDFDTSGSGGKIDSIRYEWAPLLASNTDTIEYSGNYSYYKPLYFWGFPNDVLPFPRGIHLDPQTGEIKFRPMKPEITALAIKIKEYRNGILIAELRRDIQLIIITCPLNNIENSISKSDFKIYPNPTSDFINILYQGLKKWEGTLSFYDLNSKLIFSEIINFNSANNYQTISLKGYSPGMYFLKLENTSGTVINKFFINK